MELRRGDSPQQRVLFTKLIAYQTGTSEVNPVRKSELSQVIRPPLFGMLPSLATRPMRAPSPNTICNQNLDLVGSRSSTVPIMPPHMAAQSTRNGHTGSSLSSVSSSAYPMDPAVILKI